MGNNENAEKISRKFKKHFCREQQGGIMQNIFLQGTARRPEARPEGRGREEERKAPSYGNSFHTFIYYYLLMVIVFFFILVYYYLLMVFFFIFIYYHLLRDAVKNVLADFVR